MIRASGQSASRSLVSFVATIGQSYPGIAGTGTIGGGGDENDLIFPRIYEWTAFLSQHQMQATFRMKNVTQASGDGVKCLASLDPDTNVLGGPLPNSLTRAALAQNICEYATGAPAQKIVPIGTPVIMNFSPPPDLPAPQTSGLCNDHIIIGPLSPAKFPMVWFEFWCDPLSQICIPQAGLS